MNPVTYAFPQAISTAVTAIIDTVGDVFGMITGEDFLPYFVIGIAVSLTLVGVMIVRKVVWGA